MCGSFVGMNCPGSSQQIVVRCEMELSNETSGDRTAARHRWGPIRDLLNAILLWDQGFRLFCPNRLSLALHSMPHRVMYLLIILNPICYVSSRISTLPLSRKCFLPSLLIMKLQALRWLCKLLEELARNHAGPYGTGWILSLGVLSHGPWTHSRM